MRSRSVISDYQMGTSANVARIRKTLINKDILDVHNNKIVFLDPLYRVWPKEHFFSY